MFKELTMGHAAEISVFVGILIVNLIVMYCINQVQQSPYMDEIFHIRQAKHYCQGNFTVVRKSYLSQFNIWCFDKILRRLNEKKKNKNKTMGLTCLTSLLWSNLDSPNF